MTSLAYTGLPVVADIAAVLDTRNMDEAKLFIVDEEVLVSHKYRNHSIITHFNEYGKMNSFEACIEDFIDENGKLNANITELPHVSYDIHYRHGERNRSDAFYKLLRKFLGEEE